MKHKRMMGFLLATAIICGLLTGCQEAPGESVNPSTLDVTPVTPAPELSDTLQQVYDLGIADIEVLNRAEDVCTREEAVGMLAKVHELRYGTSSKYLADSEVVEDSKETTR